MPDFTNIANGFGRARMPVENPFLSACMEIAQRRQNLITRAQAENGYIRDQDQNIKHLDKNRYSHDIKQIAALFGQLQHGSTLYSHCRALAQQAALLAKCDPDIDALRVNWGSADERQRLTGLKILSRIITDSLNESDKGLCLDYPVLSLARYPAASRETIAMQVQYFNPPQNPKTAMHLIAINSDMLNKTDFDTSTAQMWHEHQHIYMSGLRDMLRDGFLPTGHPLFKDAYKSKTINEYKIIGNIGLASDIYYAEPEEKLCYHTQNTFQTALRHIPAQPMLTVNKR